MSDVKVNGGTLRRAIAKMRLAAECHPNAAHRPMLEQYARALEDHLPETMLRHLKSQDERWEAYEGVYEKKYYNLVLTNGHTVGRPCWPNNGVFVCPAGHEYPGDTVAFFKPCDEHPLDNEVDNVG